MKQYHIALSKEHSAKYAIIPGDPGRVEKIAAFLDDAKQVGCNREYNSYLGYLDGEKVLVVSTGIGGPSCAICVEELAKIPSREVLIAMLLGTLNAPVAAFARALNAIAEKQN